MIEQFLESFDSDWNGYEELVSQLGNHLDLKGKRMYFSVLYLLFQLKEEEVEEFATFYVNQIEKIYFAQQFEFFQIDDISSDEDDN